MTRDGGQRAHRVWIPLPPILLLLFLLGIAQRGDAGDWVIGGRFGLEVDGLGQEFRTFGILDDRIDPGGSIEEQIEEPVRTRDARTLALLAIALSEKRPLSSATIPAISAGVPLSLKKTHNVTVLSGALLKAAASLGGTS